MHKFLPSRFDDDVLKISLIKFAIEFVLIVTGVFLGVQISNSNDAKNAEKIQNQILLQLRNEFNQIENDLAKGEKTYELILNSTSYVLSLLRHGEQPVNGTTLKRSLYWAVQLPPPPAPSNAFQELISTGEFSKISKHELRAALLSYNELYERSSRSNSIAISAIMNPQSKYFEAVEWSANYNHWEDIDAAIISYNWGKLSTAKSEMQTWLGHQYDGQLFIKSMRKEAKVILETLEKE